MTRHVPPMYAKVPRRVPPTGRKIAPASQPVSASVPTPEPEPAPVAPDVVDPTNAVVDVDAGVEDSDDEEEEESAGDEEEEEEPSSEDEKSASVLSQRQLNKLRGWSEDMSQRKLYALAKSVGLDVRVRDSKDDLIKKIREAGG